MGKEAAVRLHEDAYYMEEEDTVPGCGNITVAQTDWAKKQIAQALQQRALEIMEMEVEVDVKKI